MTFMKRSLNSSILFSIFIPFIFSGESKTGFRRFYFSLKQGAKAPRTVIRFSDSDLLFNRSANTDCLDRGQRLCYKISHTGNGVEVHLPPVGFREN